MTRSKYPLTQCKMGPHETTTEIPARNFGHNFSSPPARQSAHLCKGRHPAEFEAYLLHFLFYFHDAGLSTETFTWSGRSEEGSGGSKQLPDTKAGLEKGVNVLMKQQYASSLCFQSEVPNPKRWSRYTLNCTSCILFQNKSILKFCWSDTLHTTHI